MMSGHVEIADHELAGLVFSHDCAGINTSSDLDPELDDLSAGSEAEELADESYFVLFLSS